MSKNSYVNNGVFTSPLNPVLGKKVTLNYNGLLSKSGATEVYARVGFGQSWQDASDFKMHSTNDGFETTVPVTSADDLNVCFRDPAFNWDNNGGCNYTFQVVE